MALYWDAYHKTREEQRKVINECILKGSGAMALPMGFGKSLISLLVGLINYEKTREPVLVVVEKSLIPNWLTEINKFFGDKIKVQVFHQDYVKGNLAEWVCFSHVVLTTPQMTARSYSNYDVDNKYTYLQGEGLYDVRYYRDANQPFLNHNTGAGLIHSRKWGTLIVDEAQKFLTHDTYQNKSIFSISAHHRWLLSGTLLQEAKKQKIFGIYLMLNHNKAPKCFPQFKEYINQPSWKGVSEIMVKRDNNPDWTPTKLNKWMISHSLTETEAKIYLNLKILLNMLKKRLEEFKKNRDTNNVKKFSAYIMAMITYLRQCVVCPIIPITTVSIDVAGFNEDSKLAEMFVDTIKSLKVDDYLNDINSIASSRIKAVYNCYNYHPDEKIIVFSSFRTVIDTLQLFKDDAARPTFTIKGTDSINKRAQIIEQFNQSKNGIMYLTYDIGANGHNLQCASVVVLVDYWWNDGITKQSIARIHRSGQESDVNVYYMIANTGMEKGMLTMHERKLFMAEEAMVGPIKTKGVTLKINELIDIINEKDNLEILNRVVNH